MDDGEALPTPKEVETEIRAFIDRLVPSRKPYEMAQYLPIVRGGFSDEFLKMTCYADYTVHRYILGAGPRNVTVSYGIFSEESWSYDLIKRSHAAGLFGSQPLPTEHEYEQMLTERLSEPENILTDLMEGRSAVVFLAPMGTQLDIAVEAWQAVAQWDLQIDDEGTVNAISFGADSVDPGYSQTLKDLRNRITSATDSDEFAGSRIENIDGLPQFYHAIGAYDE